MYGPFIKKETARAVSELIEKQHPKWVNQVRVIHWIETSSKPASHQELAAGIIEDMWALIREID